MKINGQIVDIREVVEVVLFNEVKVKVSGYPIGIRRDYQKVYPRPLAPKKPTGVISKKDGPELKPDFEDVQYVASFDEYVHLEKFFFICKCLEADTSVSFDSDYNTLAGLRNIPGELTKAGFVEGDIGKLINAISGATRIESKAIEEAEGNF